MFFLLVLFAIIALIVTASRPEHKWLFLIAVFIVGMALASIPAEVFFTRRSESPERFVVLMLGGALMVWQRERMRPLLKNWGVITQWEKLKKRIAQQQSSNGVKPKNEETDEEKEENRLFRVAIGEAFDKLEPSEIVRGVWETVTTEKDAFSQNQKLGFDAVEAVHVGLIGDQLIVRTEKKRTYAGALENPLQPDAKIPQIIDVSAINSVELITAPQYHGDSPSSQGTSTKPSSAFLERHPFVGRSRGGTVYLDENALWMVFVFLHDGERRPFFRAWGDYDRAVKWRTQIANMLQAKRVELAQANDENDEDYL